MTESFLSASSATTTGTSVSPRQLYSLVDNVQYNATLDENGGPKPEWKLGKILGLVPKLRPYQEAAVCWMLRREGASEESPKNTEWELAWWVVTNSTFSIDFLPLVENQILSDPIGYYCPFTGWWAKTYEIARSYTLGGGGDTESSGCCGGILAESMGLGKTVEVIACILANRPAALNVPAPPTGPDIVVPDDNVQEERWIEEDENILGICICGDPVLCFGHRKPFLICSGCKEPMHTSCAGLEPKIVGDGDMSPERYKEIVFRMLFKNDTVTSRYCSPNCCPCCVAEKHRTVRVDGTSPNLIQSNATLIITPAAIITQWKREIERHTAVKEEQDGSDSTRPLNVVVYPGIQTLSNYSRLSEKNRGEDSFQLIHPARLADADVVLMTFDDLRGDLGHSDDAPYQPDSSSIRSIRGRKKYRIVPSPLLAIRWLRVCLDEAQRVETTTAASAKMALKLEARYRWCVTGTPVGRGKLEDLFGLLLFLRIDPFNEAVGKKWFSMCFDESKPGVDQRMKRLLRDIFWRSTKADSRIIGQMGVPKQVEKKVFLQLSSIERHFYQRQLEDTMNAVGDVVDMSQKKRNRNGRTKREVKQLELLSNQLQRLRAACCHPQVGAGAIKKSRQSTSNEFSRFLTMDQILDRLIDDAKLACEESQRLALMHTNAMAAISRLKPEAKGRGIAISENDSDLLYQSFKHYSDSLEIAESNSVPNSCIGEAKLSGCVGFRQSGEVVRDGIFTIDWITVQHGEENKTQTRELWSRVDFSGPAKRITEIQVKPVLEVPKHHLDQVSSEAKWAVLVPKECVLQVGNTQLGGSFVDVVSFEIPKNGQWKVTGDFRVTNKSKSWRIVVQSHHDGEKSSADPTMWYCGLDVKLLEPDVAFDSTQRLHVLHNAAKSLRILRDIHEKHEGNELPGGLTSALIESRVMEMESQAEEIERMYIESQFPAHNESQRQLELAISNREEMEKKLLGFSEHLSKDSTDRKDFLDDRWWDDLLVACSIHGSPQEQNDLCQKVHEDIASAMEGAYDRTELRKKPFPPFHDIFGLIQSISLRMSDARSRIPSGAFAVCTAIFKQFSTCPDKSSVVESSSCNRCKKDWSWRGPMCRHCKLSVRLEKMVFDRLLMLVLTAIHDWMKGSKGANNDFKAARLSSRVDERAKLFFAVHDEYKKEKSAAENAWRMQMELLNDLDELDMCKQAMRLTLEGENLTELSEAELNSVVHPIDVASKFMDHNTKQATCLANLRRHKSTLRYLKNQNLERAKLSERKEAGTTSECAVCLSPLDESRAVLKCGHSFHRTPCLDRLLSRCGNQTVTCPMRCPMRTGVNEIMMAYDKCRDDGSKVSRKVIGSWGTKVTRLVADIMDMLSLGEKGLVFSQWEDLLDIVGEALKENQIQYTRAHGASSIAKSTKRLHSDCSVFLLNVKNGAEGLTLTCATHVFMIEPLLNAGQDSQAINRIHRIGQTMVTYVHRYIVENTCEVKIDQLRMQRQQENDFDDTTITSRDPSQIKAGGIDGGFSSQEELMDILKLD